MKLKKTNAFIIVSSISLFIVMIIQVNWIIQTAKIKEDLFNEKANMILSKTAATLCSDQEACNNMGSCCADGNTEDCKLKLGENEIHKIDSILKSNMLFYDIHLDYSFEVIKTNKYSALTNYFPKNKTVYGQKLLEVAHKNGLILNLVFPDKKQFVMAEMGPMFVASIILILVVLFLFYRTVKSLIIERQISEHTTDYLNNMTHEFKTPLTNIALAGKMIVSSNNNEGKTKHYTDIILSENEKLRLQVEQVLSMAALERGEIPISKSSVDFHLIIEAAIKNIALLIENKNGNISTQFNAKDFIIYGDKNHLINVIGNLLDNSIKYSESAPSLKLVTYNLEKTVVLEITDNGIGIDTRFQKKIFEKYFRVPTGDVHNVKGFGIGLAYVKKIIEMHGGFVSIQSSLGKGTTFTIKLPLNND